MLPVPFSPITNVSKSSFLVHWPRFYLSPCPYPSHKRVRIRGYYGALCPGSCIFSGVPLPLEVHERRLQELWVERQVWQCVGEARLVDEVHASKNRCWSNVRTPEVLLLFRPAAIAPVAARVRA